MSILEFFISCDWGTSNFRLRVVHFKTLKIIEEIKTDQGIKKIFNNFKIQNEYNQLDFFSNYLIRQIQLLPIKYQNYIIISSGMVSSSIGLYELDYAKMPFSAKGDSLNMKYLKLNNRVELLLISGIKNDCGMMRGEETQAIGLQKHLSEDTEGILLLPGTHSKHLGFKNGIFIGLKSFMTGELFEILSQKSILSNSIIEDVKNDISECPFLEGVKLGSQGKLSSSLFTVRANDLFGKSTKNDNYFFLSGLLIGDELAYLKKENKRVFLAAPYPLINLYQIALNYLLGSDNYVVFNEDIVEKALLIGQKKILELYDK